MATLHEKMEDLKIEKNPSDLLPENVIKVEENPSNLLPEKIKKEKNKKSGVSDKKAGNTLEVGNQIEILIYIYPTVTCIILNTHTQICMFSSSLTIGIFTFDVFVTTVVYRCNLVSS